MGGERVPFRLPRLPKLGDYYLHFVMKDENDHPLSGKSYILYNNDGEIVETGILDEEGKLRCCMINLKKSTIFTY